MVHEELANTCERDLHKELSRRVTARERTELTKCLEEMGKMWFMWISTFQTRSHTRSTLITCLQLPRHVFRKRRVPSTFRRVGSATCPARAPVTRDNKHGTHNIITKTCIPHSQ